MPQVTYGGKHGETVDLEVDPDLLAVRTRSRRSLRTGPVPSPEAALVNDMDLVLAFPRAGVEVFRRRDAEAPAVAEISEELRQSPDTRFAGRVLVDPTSGEPVLYTENLFVKFQDDVDPDVGKRVLLEAGLTIREQLSYAANSFVVSAPEGTGQVVFEIAQRLLQRPDVDFAHPELIRKAARRSIFPQQWHLATTTINGQTVAASANVAAAHGITQGAGVTIAIIDDGCDIEHEEFSSPGKIVAPRDVTGNDDDPRPGPGDYHGTACAGVACAGGQFGASGVAPKAGLMPIRLQSGLGSQQEANSFIWAADHGADVISCSWGPMDGAWFQPNDPQHNVRVPLPDSTRLAIDYAVTRGRGGKGCVIFFAAGNGNESVDLDGYASYSGVLAVAAINDRGVRSVYSDKGSAVACSFPSNDFRYAPENRPAPLTPGIWTTDITGQGGYNPNPNGQIAGDPRGNYTNSFGGTSSACPGAAGVAALVISRNPNLGWQEVRSVLQRSCERIDLQGGQWDANGHSPFYGFGRLNALTAVELAVPPTSDRMVISKEFNEPIKDLQTTRVSLDVGEQRALRDLKVSVDIRHSYIGDLVVILRPPDAVAEPVILHNRTGGRTRDVRRTYGRTEVPELAGLAGVIAQGNWSLEVRDEALRDVGGIAGFGLELLFV